MLSHLRSRLLLTYSLVIIVVLGIVGASLILFILRNPTIDRQTYIRLEQSIEFVQKQSLIQSSTQVNLSHIIQRIDDQADVRVLIISPESVILYDSRINSEDLIHPNLRKTLPSRRGIVLDPGSNVWQFVWRPLEDGGYLIMSTPRIRRVTLLFSQKLRDVLRDDLLPPLIRGGVAALLIALILAFWMAKWISSPLKQMSESVNDFPNNAFNKVPIEGPEEVKSLSMAFNNMFDQVAASQKSQRDFVANVSHELKTPLTSIQGFSQAIIDGTIGTSDEVEQAALIIHKEADRMHRLVLELLELARLEAGTIVMKHDQIDLNAILNNVIERFFHQANHAGVILTYLQSEESWLYGDGERLMQAFSNLVDNALKNTPNGGFVSIEANQTGTDLTVSIRDTGVGIPDGEKARIFERFYQIDKSRSGDKERGIGLGLSIANEIILAHSGSITVLSEEGQGCNFMVKIPLK